MNGEELHKSILEKRDLLSEIYSTRKVLLELEEKCNRAIDSYKTMKSLLNIREDNIKKKEEEINSIIEKKLAKLIDKEKEINEVLILREKNIVSQEKALRKIYEEKSKGFPWLAEAIADYYRYVDFEIADYIENKSHPAYKKAENVREIGRAHV